LVLFWDCAIIENMQAENVIQNGVESGRPRERKGFLGVLLALVLAFGSFVSGMQVDSLINKEDQSASLFSFFRNESTEPVSEVDLTQFWKVWHLLEDKYISASSTDAASADDRLFGAIEGMVASYGDPYTVFMPPVKSAAFAEDISGNFSGIGMEVGIKENVVTIIAPLPGTPAEKAGLLAKDMIIKIDDKSTEGMQIDEAVRMIRGEKGTTVTLSVFREGELEIKEIPVVRDTINIPTVKTETINGTFVISLYSFNAISESKMADAMREFKVSGTKKLVLDLRGNPGGYLESAVSIASYFLPAGKVVVREHFGENNEEKQYRSQGRMSGEYTPENFVVLVDGGSASASEILAGALKEHKVAKVVGVNTFGKGSVQELVELSDGSSVKITIARWLTPDGLSISDGGLAPDIIISRTPQERIDGVDKQKDAALKLLNGEEVVSE
jgi:carboxyl-terminal processing protease